MNSNLNESEIRHQVVALLKSHAHMSFAEAVADFPMEFINTKPPQVDYTPWHLLEHLRFTQADILEFIQSPKYTDKRWPLDYWPSPTAQATPKQWQQTINQFQANLDQLIKLAQNKSIILTDPLPYAKGEYKGYTYLRELLLAADHNAYHIGEFAILRQVMGTWPKNRN